MYIPKFSVDDIGEFIGKSDEFYILGIGFEAIRMKKRLENASKKVIAFIDLSEKKDIPIIENVEVISIDRYLGDNKPLIVASLQDIHSPNWEIEASQLLINRYNKQPFVDFVALMGYFEGMEHMSRYKQLIGSYFYEYYKENRNKFDEALDCLEDDYSKNIFQKIIKYKLMCLDIDTIDTKDLLISKEDILNCEAKEQEIMKNLDFITDERLKSMTASHLATQSYSYQNIVYPNKKETILDVGAYNGDTALMFSYLSKNANVYAFEPVLELNGQLEKAVKISPNIQVVKKGAWSETTTLKFNTLRRENYIGVGSFVSDEGKDQIDVITIDKFVEDNDIKSVEFIKMDIEGAEVHALNGAYKTITDHKPDLAICIYHEPSHLWEIPLWIKKNFPEYKIYVDHKYLHPVESVCYATIKK